MRPEEQTRLARKAQFVREIKSLRLAGDENALRLRPEKIDAVAERLSYGAELPRAYTLVHLSRHLDHMTQHHRELRRTKDEVERERLAGLPESKINGSAGRKLSAEEKLDLANREAYARANTPKKDRDE